jgi:hypothetical protein
MIKAQFMQLWDGLTTDNESTVLVMGATNRPKDVDKAILRYRGVLFLNFFINIFFSVPGLGFARCFCDPCGPAVYFQCCGSGIRCLFDPGIRNRFLRIPDPKTIILRAQ